MPELKRITVPQFAGFKAAGQKISMLTAYDYTMAGLLDAAGVEGILVGDTLGMVVQGHETTLPVTLDQIIYHAEMVARAVHYSLVVCDMPFLTYQAGRDDAIRNAGRVLKETRCQAVKLEGGEPQSDVIAALVHAGIPVMAHCGLRPQNINQLGSYRVQRDEAQLMVDARAAEQAGAFAVVLEAIPAAMAKKITAALKIPTIGIGAGVDCDGQILVINDMLGMTGGHVPKFVKKYADLREAITSAAEQYKSDVQSGKFPAEEHSFR